MPRLLDVFVRFLRLGFTAFGGPIAHLGYFEREFVERARWLDRDAFAEIVALCTVLPGPTSSQVGMLLGARRAGPAGALAAWIAFTAPSALALACIGTAMRIVLTPVGDHPGRYPPSLTRTVYVYLATHQLAQAALRGALVGAIMTALAVVLFAVVALARGIVRTGFAAALVLVAFAAALAQIWYAPQYAWTVLVVGAVAGALFAPPRPTKAAEGLPAIPIPLGVTALALWVALLVLLPIFATSGYLALFAQTFRAGSLVFGGGHVVLSFLLPAANALARSGEFQSGYAIAQALPGPLFSFASYLGATDDQVPSALTGAAVATIGIFLPSACILPAALSLWTTVSRSALAQRVLTGLGVSVVGLLAATFGSLLRFDYAYGVRPMRFVLFAFAFVLLARAKWPSWAVVLAISLGAALYGSIPNLPIVLQLR
jgi:chromate transporter